MTVPSRHLPALLFGGALVFGAFLFLRPGPFWQLAAAGMVVAGWLACTERRLVLLTSGLALGLLSGYLHRAPQLPPELLDGREYVWTGYVEEARTRSSSQTCLVRVGDVKVRVLLCSGSPPVAAGDSLRFVGAADVNDPFAPVGRPGLSYGSGLESDVAGMVIVGPTAFRVIGHRPNFRTHMASISASICKWIYASGLDPTASALLCSAWLGRDDVPPDFRHSFRALGLSHLLCVSGMHVGLVAMVIALMLRPLAFFRRRAFRYGLIALLIWAYAALTGLQPSVFRAAAMITVFYVMELAQVNRNTLNTLFLAASVVLIVNPRWIFAIGFQLSVMAVLGIVVLIPFLNPLIGSHDKVGVKVANAVMLPVAVTITTFPVVAYWFHSLSLVGVPANIVAALLFPVFMFAGIIAAVLLHCGAPSVLIATPVDAFANFLRRACDFGDTMADGLYLSDWRLTLMMLVLLGALMAVRYLRAPFGWGALGICLTVMVVLVEMPYNARREVVVYSRGGHTSALISGQPVPLYASTRTSSTIAMPAVRYFALQGYDPDAITRLRPGNRTAEVILLDSLLILPADTINLRALRHTPTLQVHEY